MKLKTKINLHEGKNKRQWKIIVIITQLSFCVQKQNDESQTWGGGYFHWGGTRLSVIHR